MNKIVIIGAGSAMFAKKLIGDLLLFDDMQIDTISLVDINKEKLVTMKAVAEKMCVQADKPVIIEASENRRDVLKGASYVINTINTGGPLRYKEDLEIADKYGVYQCVGDIIGPGGIFRMLRAYPVILQICKDMEELCPEAYFFNYTNPMAPICLALHYATSIKVIGFCHNIQSTVSQLAAYLKADRKDVSFWAAGINHMDWFLEFKIKGKDAYPKLFELAKSRESILELQKLEPDYGPEMGVELYDLVRFDIMNHFGYFVSESPFHMSEYVPYYRKNMEMIRALKVDRRWWLDHELEADAYFEELKGILERDEEIPIEKTFEYAPEIIHAHLTGKPFRANLNVMNTGLIENLPQDCIVEVPCYADGEGIHPCYAGQLPAGLAALNLTNINMHKLMAKAVNEKSISYIRQAVYMDPLTSAVCNLHQIHQMVEELIEANKEYLQGYK